MIDYWYTVLTKNITELEYQIRDSEAKLVLAGPEQVPVALEAASRVGLTRDSVYLFCDLEEDFARNPSQPRLWTDIWRSAEEIQSWSWKKMGSLQEAKQTTAIINYSSGYVQVGTNCYYICS